ncbi:unnamed protein product [Peniophora sp. CBMAI 1063]|nr:unnamed protein product [Peniophora sp. CBMAI 1063]
MSSRKRKYRGQHPNRSRGKYEGDDEPEGDRQEPEQHWQHPTQQEHEYDPALHIVAHEADIERGPGAARAADALEARLAHLPGSRLIRLGWESLEGKDVWVDRYDARLLLDGPPVANGAGHDTSSDIRSSSPGWSDLPSDAEDTFFLAPEDIEDYERDKRRRAIEQLREDRMRALAADDEEEPVDEDPWGGSDEEPDDAQRAIMQRTAGHLLASPNAAQLEMRILANHGSKREFSFLRGRWARAWATVKAQVRAEKQGPPKKVDAGLGGLTAYDSGSDDGSNEEAEETSATVQTRTAPDDPTSDTHIHETLVHDEDAAKQARRARAREWAERRRAEKVG